MTRSALHRSLILAITVAITVFMALASPSIAGSEHQPDGKTHSDPDDNGNGPDRSNGGADTADHNNGCGNDADGEDDSEGWCGNKHDDDDGGGGDPGDPGDPGDGGGTT